MASDADRRAMDRRPTGIACLLLAVAATLLLASTPSLANAASGAKLKRSLDRIVKADQGPPGLSVLIQRGDRRQFLRRGVGNVMTGSKPTPNQHIRIASMAKALNGAVALALDSKGKLDVKDRVGQVLPNLWPKARRVTVAEMLQHTARLPDYIRQDAFVEDLQEDPEQYLTPRQLLSYVDDKSPKSRDEVGSRYFYSDSDNIVVGLMAERVSGRPYEKLLRRFVYRKAGMRDTSLPRKVRMPRPYMHGYDVRPNAPPQDVSEFINPALAWASGGIVSTPRDVGRFFRAYVGGELFGLDAQIYQRDFVKGSSDPPGPGRIRATLGLFKYKTRCGKIFGHTGSFPGYRLFGAATRNGQRSVVFTVNSQIVPGDGSERVSDLIREAQVDAVCHALR